MYKKVASIENSIARRVLRRGRAMAPYLVRKRLMHLRAPAPPYLGFLLINMGSANSNLDIVVVP
jgi:hypothetical protein